MEKFDPLQIPERLRVRAFFIGNLELAKAIKSITQQPVTLEDILIAKKTVTRQQIHDYVQRNGLPQELLDMDKESPNADGYHLRQEGDKYLFFCSERGGKGDIKTFEDWESMARFVVDQYFDDAFR